MQGELHRQEKKVLLALEEEEETSPQDIARRANLELSSVNRALSWLSLKGLVELEDYEDEMLELGPEGEVYLEKGLPERRVEKFLEGKGGVEVGELQQVLDKEEVNIALGWLKRKHLARIEGGTLKLSQDREREAPDEKLLRLLKKEGSLMKRQIAPELRKGAEMLKKRKNVVRAHEVTQRRVRLTGEGRELLKQGLTIEEEITQLTPGIIRKGEWKEKKFRSYRVDTPAPEFLPAKHHPLREMVEEIRAIFLKMGFREISGPLVESAFWNFDALFVPQDHPAREMQDTFYLSSPSEAELPEERVVRNVKRAHEEGLKGSKGWGYSWSREKARAALLRTHTTATTIRHLSRKEEAPVKVFSVDRVFRNERLSFKHLPEFHQSEGIVVGDVGFTHLLGILKEFYSRMGFPKVRFRPGYFPYTEPSLEVEVFFEERGKWMELGGAGIFRPEVTEPLGVEKPVLAWGLGLERLAMLRLGLEDIRQLYLTDLKWLQRLEVL